MKNFETFNVQELSFDEQVNTDGGFILTCCTVCAGLCVGICATPFLLIDRMFRTPNPPDTLRPTT